MQPASQLTAVIDERCNVGLGKTDSWRRLSIVFDVWMIVQMMREGVGQVRNFRVWLRIIPTYALFASENGVAVLHESPQPKIHDLENAYVQSIEEMNLSPDDSCQ